MEPNVNNPHDRYFRSLFSNPEDARIFLKYFLPPNVVQLLELEQLKLESGSYIDEKLREHLTDILYSVPLRSGKTASIYCLFEHKSSPEASIHLQILRYSYERWQADTQAKTEWRPIVAVVFYHGQKKWTTPTQFKDCFENVNPLFEKYLPNFEYVLIDTSQFDDEVLRQIESSTLQAGLFLLKYIYDDELVKHLRDVVQPLQSLSDTEILDQLWSILTYISSATGKVREPELQKTITDVFEDSDEVLMTLVEKWLLEGEEIGIRKGEEIGIRKGEEIGKQKTIKQIIKSRFEALSDELASLVDGCQSELIDDAVNVALEAKSLDELTASLLAMQDKVEEEQGFSKEK